MDVDWATPAWAAGAKNDSSMCEVSETTRTQAGPHSGGCAQQRQTQTRILNFGINLHKQSFRETYDLKGLQQLVTSGKQARVKQWLYYSTVLYSKGGTFEKTSPV